MRRSVSNDQRAPCGLARGAGVGVELPGAADFLEHARGADHAVGVEVRGGALEAVRGAAQRLAVALVERLPDLLEMPRRVVDEEAADLRQQLAVAADARQHLIGDVGNCRRRTPARVPTLIASTSRHSFRESSGLVR